MRRLFATTLTELSAIAALASTGLNRMPNAGNRITAAAGLESRRIPHGA